MFIFISYKDAPELSTIRRRSSASQISEDLSVEKTLLVNPVCPVRIMLEYIRKKCNLGIYTNFDLCDENGVMKGLFDLETYAYATDQFEHRKTYYVVVIKLEPDKRLSLIPQLNHENKLFLVLKERCRQAMMTVTPSSATVTALDTPPKVLPIKVVQTKQGPTKKKK